MIQFHSLKLPQLPQYNATKLTQLASKSDRLSLKSPSNIPTAKTPPPRHIDEILADIQENRTVTLLEWVYCLQAKAGWDRQHPDKRFPSAKAIWRAAGEDENLQRLLEWRLALYRRGFKDAIAPSLANVAMIEFEGETDRHP